jgi:drug/metabolite transporter (DMT)-like permease
MRLAILIDFVLLAAIWGASFLLMKLGAAEFGPFVTAFLRVFFASLCLLPLLAWRGQLPALRNKLKPILAVGVLNSGLPFALFAFAVLHISTGLSSILNATVPLWGAVVAWAWLGDRLTASRTLGLVIGFVGVALLAWDKASFQAGAALPGWAVLACLAATLLYGIAASFAKKHLVGVPPLASASGSQIGATLVLLVPALLSIPATMPSGQAWAAIILLAFFCTAVAYVLYFRIIERAGPARAVTVTFLIPVFGVAYGGLFLNEVITGTMLACGAVIVLGTALSTGLLGWRHSVPSK